MNIVNELKAKSVDFEFYPSTEEIIQAVKARLKGTETVLDVGAGDARVLIALTTGKKFAIEKCRIHTSKYSKDVFTIGTDFFEQTLIDKPVDIVFSNCPFSLKAKWCEKLILEAQAKRAYLVLPKGWENISSIQEALKKREAETEVILETDFLNAERQARVYVDVIEVRFNVIRFRDRISEGREPIVNAFSLWFNANFGLETQNEDIVNVEEAVKNFQLVNGVDIVSKLEKLYQRDFSNLLNAYKAITQIDKQILSELDIKQDALAGGLEQKITSLKCRYWKILFNNLDKITNRLTSSSRQKLFEVLTANTHVDFTLSNIYSILEWVIRNANDYFEEQLIEVYRKMSYEACVILYKSNQKVYSSEQWRYTRYDRDRGSETATSYMLDYRIILDLTWQPFDFFYTPARLRESVADFLNDICAIAYNLGFDNWNHERAKDFEWEPGKKCVFHYRNHKSGKDEVLFDAKVFKKGSVHIRMNQSLIKKLNVEAGRLLGWVKSKEQAAEEMDLDINEVADCFGCNKRIGSSVEILGIEYDVSVN